MAEYSSIAEVYTASWCENCVFAEEGLYAAIAEATGETTVLTFHRAIGEVEDPFGVESADLRWEGRYGKTSKDIVSVMRAPPTIIINGETMHAGSGGLGGDQLKPYYAESLSQPPQFSLESANSSLSWSSEDMASGTLTWNLEAGDWLPESTTSIVFVVEASATFEEGSNGLGDYHDVVRDMVELDGNSGSMNYTLPAAWDGEDLSLVLVHQWSEELEIACCDVNPSGPDYLALWLSFGIGGFFAIVFIIGLIISTKKNEELEEAVLDQQVPVDHVAQQQRMQASVNQLDQQRSQAHNEAEQLRKQLSDSTSYTAAQMEAMQAQMQSLQETVAQAEKEKTEMQDELEKAKSTTIVQNITYNIQDSAISGDINATELKEKDD
uniref:Thioredoxin domain-containing protein n=1 Tax=uncultured marine group II/III euryarchaeote KM3_26_H05 TaxID=1456427 RepID=A0A075GW87_9EURY|nr:hypothetical protein [uncultured marine group II/III euryarchaeote KM3_26_H05]